MTNFVFEFGPRFLSHGNVKKARWKVSKRKTGGVLQIGRHLERVAVVNC